MRVQLIESDPGREDGAVAIVVAVSLIVLLGLAAFAVDFGLAYSNKRQVQTSADAAALAAAGTLADESVSCVGVAEGDPPAALDPSRPLATLMTEAETAGTNLTDENHYFADYVPASMEFTCEGGAINVSWTNESVSDVSLGSVLGGDEIEVNRSAVAALDVPPGVASGLRPFPFCSKYLPQNFDPSFSSYPSKVYRVEGPNTKGNDPKPEDPADDVVKGDPGCPKPGGNWYHANCPETANNGVPQLQEAIMEGCKGAVKEVDRTAYSAGPPVNGVELIAAGCPPNDPPDLAVPDDCLKADPGNFNPSLAEKWEEVMQAREPIPIPVFCGTPPCGTPGVVMDGGGNTVEYPVYRIMNVQICGYFFGKGDKKSGQITDGLCAESNMPSGATDPFGRTLPYTVKDPKDTNQTNYFLVVYTSAQTAPVFGDSTCTIGDVSCDGGLRRTILVE
ncbi:Tad domain-containing protein [Salsipaludibacter albus]|uniref:Tad domain-containing protein n=1 Tax=Salsipaludibacter albus TaxID=2849650 RepID=UPI001EE3F70A|nr:Tad domain-containing protein [Salsipaludibacter albus]MBY5162908.1 Tad domain-containing protein [Salsipaludibacter albus]